MSAFEILQGTFQSLPRPSALFFGFQLRVLRDQYEFEYQLDYPLPCCIRFFIPFDEFSLLSPKASISLSWLGTSFHFAITCLMLWDMFVDHDHFLTPYTYHGPSIPFFVRFLIQFSTRCSYFHYGKVKCTFSHSHFFQGFSLITQLFFSMEFGLKVESRIHSYRWSINLMIVCFSHFLFIYFLSWIIWSHLQPSHNGHLSDSKVLIIHPNFRLPSLNHVYQACVILLTIRNLSLIYHDHLDLTHHGGF